MLGVVINKNRIDDLRVTIFDVVHYLEAGRSIEEIATILSLTREQVEAAVHYIQEHHKEVLAVHQQIEERIARGNPPEIETHARVGRARMEALRRHNGSANSNGVDGEGIAG